MVYVHADRAGHGRARVILTLSRSDLLTIGCLPMLTVASSPQTEENPLIERTSVPELDGILGHPFKVLDDGFVRVVDYMGTDSSIVQAARVSYGTGTKRVREDRALIRYLLRHAHTTPFEMCDIKLHVRVPMDIWRQWIRHRTASSRLLLVEGV